MKIKKKAVLELALSATAACLIAGVALHVFYSGVGGAYQSKGSVLADHLQTQKILSPAQVEKYDELRGYKR